MAARRLAATKGVRPIRRGQVSATRDNGAERRGTAQRDNTGAGRTTRLEDTTATERDWREGDDRAGLEREGEDREGDDRAGREERRCGDQELTGRTWDLGRLTKLHPVIPCVQGSATISLTLSRLAALFQSTDRIRAGMGRARAPRRDRRVRPGLRGRTVRCSIPAGREAVVSSLTVSQTVDGVGTNTWGTETWRGACRKPQEGMDGPPPRTHGERTRISPPRTTAPPAPRGAGSWLEG